MFDNLFSILGPVFSAGILVAVVVTFAIFPMHRLGCHRLNARRERGRGQARILDLTNHAADDQADPRGHSRARRLVDRLF